MMVMTTSSRWLRTCAALASVLAGAPACTDEDATLRERLVAGAAATLDPEATTLSMNVRYYHDPPSWRSSRVTLVATAGALQLSAAEDGRVALDAASLEFEPIDLGKASGIAPAHLLFMTGIRFRTEDRHECDAVDWSPDGKECSANVPAELVFEYRMMGFGPRAATEGVGRATLDLKLDVARPAADIAVRLRGRSDGLFGAWNGVLEFRDLELSTRGVVGSEGEPHLTEGLP